MALDVTDANIRHESLQEVFFNGSGDDAAIAAEKAEAAFFLRGSSDSPI
jgi:hypothetical protein